MSKTGKSLFLLGSLARICVLPTVPSVKLPGSLLLCLLVFFSAAASSSPFCCFCLQSWLSLGLSLRSSALTLHTHLTYQLWPGTSSPLSPNPLLSCLHGHLHLNEAWVLHSCFRSEYTALTYAPPETQSSFHGLFVDGWRPFAQSSSRSPSHPPFF